jgi:hypothetical protein
MIPGKLFDWYRIYQLSFKMREPVFYKTRTRSYTGWGCKPGFKIMEESAGKNDFESSR